MFYTNKENNNYIMVNKQDLYLLDAKGNIYNEIISIIMAIKSYSRNHGYMFVGDIALKNDNIVAQYLLNETTKIINDDLDINIYKIANALSIAFFENNPIYSELLYLFKNRVCGTRDGLIQKYNEEAIDYILKNNDFKYHVEISNGTYTPKFYIVYEKGECIEKKLIDGKILKLKNI